MHPALKEKLGNELLNMTIAYLNKVTLSRLQLKKVI